MKEHDPENPGWKLRRPFGPPGSPGVHHVTFSCLDRLPLFHRAATREAFSLALLAAAAAGELKLFAWVVMPEHVHLLVARGDRPIGTALGRLKSRFARSVFALWDVERPDAVARLTREDGSRRFWLRGEGYDRTMRSDDDCREKSVYIHANPVRRGLVKLPSEWRWSSAGWPGFQPAPFGNGTGATTLGS